MNKPEHILIVTGGTVKSDFLTAYIAKESPDYIIGVDRGLNTLIKLKIEPDLVLGDFDSANEGVKALYEGKPNVIILNPKKDYTDTHMACLEAIKLKPRKVDIIGGTGTRIDHLSGNLGLLKLLLDEGIEGTILDSNNKITMIDKHYKICKKDLYGKYISCIPFSDKVSGVSISGFEYDLEDATMIKEYTIGISNELREEEGHIRVKEGYLLIMETKD